MRKSLSLSTTAIVLTLLLCFVVSSAYACGSGYSITVSVAPSMCSEGSAEVVARVTLGGVALPDHMVYFAVDREVHPDTITLMSWTDTGGYARATYGPDGLTGTVTITATGDYPGYPSATCQTTITETPGTPVVTDGGDITTLSDRLSASWTASGSVAEYMYGIATFPVITDPMNPSQPQTPDVIGWTSTGISTAIEKTGLNLKCGKTYYIFVKARTGDCWSEIGRSDGIIYGKTSLGTESYTFTEDSCTARTVTYPNTTKTVYTYDERYRLTQVRHATASNSMLAQVDYKVDGVGNRKEMLLNNIPTNNTVYDYDAMNRLISAHYPFQLNATLFGYDWVGNRAISGFSYNAADMLTGSGYSYYPAGSLETGGSPSHTFTYDFRDLLTTVVY